MPAARGVLLQYESATDVYTTSPGVDDFTLPLGQAETYEEDSHDVTAGSVHLKTGKILNQPFTVPIAKWDGSNTHHAAVRTALTATTALTLKVTTKDTEVYTFDAFVTDLSIDNPKSGSLGASITFQPTGDIAIS